MHKLTFYLLKDHQPKDGDRVIFVYTGSWNGTVELRSADVEYSWFEVDQDGDTGTQFFYEPGAPSPDGCELRIMFDAICQGPETLWCPSSAIVDLVDEAPVKTGELYVHFNDKSNVKPELSVRQRFEELTKMTPEEFLNEWYSEKIPLNANTSATAEWATKICDSEHKERSD